MRSMVSYTAAFSAWDKGIRWAYTPGMLQDLVQHLLLPNVVNYAVGLSSCMKGDE